MELFTIGSAILLAKIVAAKVAAAEVVAAKVAAAEAAKVTSEVAVVKASVAQVTSYSGHTANTVYQTLEHANIPILAAEYGSAIGGVGVVVELSAKVRHKREVDSRRNELLRKRSELTLTTSMDEIFRITGELQRLASELSLLGVSSV